MHDDIYIQSCYLIPTIRRLINQNWTKILKSWKQNLNRDWNKVSDQLDLSPGSMFLYTKCQKSLKFLLILRRFNGQLPLDIYIFSYLISYEFSFLIINPLLIKPLIYSLDKFFWKFLEYHYEMKYFMIKIF